MAEKRPISPAQLLALAKQLKQNQAAAPEAQALEQLAQTGLNDAQQAQLHSVMQDKERLQALLNSPQAQALLQKIGKKSAP
ncbi:MAG: hypothetical protein LBB50_05800 [Oscillospiraceae bacterium]|jgi:hypothetical protein|nr:hypothetical protein [Oscillospiraceae bacterium]